MKVFLDTNVLAAAFGTRGLCADLLREVLLRHDLLTCVEVEKELDRALRMKFGVPPKIARETLRFLREASTRVPSVSPYDLPLREAADIRIVSAALDGRAEAFVTGDREIQGLEAVEDMEVHSPRSFWESIRRGGGG